ncbi:hypothetical protein [Burkholderia cepacia]|nr:hypothetical protein [Burkholderia cepacia]
MSCLATGFWFGLGRAAADLAIFAGMCGIAGIAVIAIWLRGRR